MPFASTVPPTIPLTTNSFAKANVAIVFGWIFAAHEVGAASAAGLTRTWAGDDQLTFDTGLLCLLAAASCYRVGCGPGFAPAPSREREASVGP